MVAASRKGAINGGDDAGLQRRLSASRARVVVVHALRASATRGFVRFGHFMLPCALGRSGVRTGKREGDGATPRGTFALEAVYYDARRVARPVTSLHHAQAVGARDGWCDARGDRNYNRRVRLPYLASCEMLLRDDGLYDVVVVIDYNRVPRVQGRGSAIFMHVARDGFQATEGCVALRRSDLLRLLRALPRGALIRI